MPRVRPGAARHRKKVRILKAAKGYRGARSKLHRTAKEIITRAGVFAYRDRKARKRDFRRLWIVRINAAARLEGLSYSSLICGLKRAGIEVDRKVLAEMAVNEHDAFHELVTIAKTKLAA